MTTLIASLYSHRAMQIIRRLTLSALACFATLGAPQATTGPPFGSQGILDLDEALFGIIEYAPALDEQSSGSFGLALAAFPDGRVLRSVARRGYGPPFVFVHCVEGAVIATHQLIESEIEGLQASNRYYSSTGRPFRTLIIKTKDVRRGGDVRRSIECVNDLEQLDHDHQAPVRHSAEGITESARSVSSRPDSSHNYQVFRASWLKCEDAAWNLVEKADGTIPENQVNWRRILRNVR